MLDININVFKIFYIGLFGLNLGFGFADGFVLIGAAAAEDLKY